MKQFSKRPEVPSAAVKKSDEKGFFFADAEEKEVSNVKRDINSTVSLDKYTRLWPLCMRCILCMRSMSAHSHTHTHIAAEVNISV